jgi:hypothetical protein
MKNVSFDELLLVPSQQSCINFIYHFTAWSDSMPILNFAAIFPYIGQYTKFTYDCGDRTNNKMFTYNMTLKYNIPIGWDSVTIIFSKRINLWIAYAYTKYTPHSKNIRVDKFQLHHVSDEQQVFLFVLP